MHAADGEAARMMGHALEQLDSLPRMRSARRHRAADEAALCTGLRERHCAARRASLRRQRCGPVPAARTRLKS